MTACVKNCLRWTLVIMVAALLLPAGPARATQTEPMTVRAMADHAAAIFVGTVTARSSVKHDDWRGIETTVTFADLTWLKGAPDDGGATLELVVPGGRVGSWTARLAGAPALDVGARVVLFVLPSYALHPVVGVMRGAIHVMTDDHGVERVTSMGGAITGLTGDGYLEIAAPAPTVAPNAAVTERTTAIDAHAAPDLEHALTLDAFLALLDPIARTSTTHRDVETPGVRRAVRFRAAPIVTRPVRERRR